MSLASVARRRVVVLGASSNIGLATVRRLRSPGRDVVGVAPRRPDPGTAVGVEWVGCDLTRDDLSPFLHGADAVVHVTPFVRPSRHHPGRWPATVEALDRVLTACQEVRLPKLVVVSSAGAYSARRDNWPVNEAWPTHGRATSVRSRHMAYVERMLDTHESVSETRIVRLRPCLTFQPTATPEHGASGTAPGPAWGVRMGPPPLVPDLRQVAFQAVHTDDLVDAIQAAVDQDGAGGAYNIATPDILSTADVAHLLRARTVPVPFRVARAVVGLSWRLGLHPVDPDWLDIARWSPLLDSTRARNDLRWQPAHSGRDALQSLLSGVAAGTSTTLPDGDHRDPIRDLLTRGRVHDPRPPLRLLR